MVAILHPIGPGPQIPVDRAVVLIGRSPECDAVIDCSSKISRVHCALVQVDNDYFIRDLGSMNGVWVAGQRTDRECRLSNGVEIAVGDVKFLFLENVNLPSKARPPARNARPSAEPVDVIDDVEIVDDVAVAGDPTVRETPPSRTGVKAPDAGIPKLSLNPDQDSSAIDDVEVVEDIELVEDVDVIEDVELVEAVDVIDDVELVEDVEVIEDVRIVEQPPRHDRSPRRLR